MKTFGRYLTEMGVDQMGGYKQAAKAIAPDLVDSGAEFTKAIPGVGSLVAGAAAAMKLKNAAMTVYQTLKQGQRSASLQAIKQAMMQADNTRDAQNAFDIDDKLADMLNDKTLDKIAQIVFDRIQQYNQDWSKVPANFANQIAYQYVKAIVG